LNRFCPHFSGYDKDFSNSLATVPKRQPLSEQRPGGSH